jgi:hypothetical protein
VRLVNFSRQVRGANKSHLAQFVNMVDALRLVRVATYTRQARANDLIQHIDYSR